MGFNIINMDTWNRRECFNHFFNNAKMNKLCFRKMYI